MTESDLIAIFECRGYICIRTTRSYHAILAIDIVNKQVKENARSAVEVSAFTLPEARKQSVEQFFDQVLASGLHGNTFDINQQHVVLGGGKPEVPEWKGWDINELRKMLNLGN